MAEGTYQGGHGDVRVISPHRSWWRVELAEAWHRRELLRVFVWRSVVSRYRQMVLGVTWSLFEPLAILLIMTVVFGFILRTPTEGVPYPVFAFSGLLPWMLFSRCAMAASSSLVENMALISKVYFPRILLPLAALARESFDMAITVGILIALAAAYGFWPRLELLALPLALLGALTFALGVGLWLASVTVRFRDLRPVLGILLQVGMYASPILYSPTLVPEPWQWLYRCNPMYWAIEASRFALLGRPFEVTPELGFSLVFVTALLASGVLVFSYQERGAVDVQ